MIYLDHAAATPLDVRVVESMQPYFTERYYNPSATYLAAKAVAKDVAEARAHVAKTLGVRPAEIIFTAGGTEANNLAIRGVMESFPGSAVAISAIEHESVRTPAALYEHQELSVDSHGLIDMQNFAKKITDKTVLISVMYANNEIGTIQPLHEVAQVVQSIRAQRRNAGNALPLYFHTDAAQAGNYLRLLVDTLGVDLMTLNGGKIYGPKQSGALYVKAGTKLAPQILGGGQEFGYRSGTENVASIIGFATALVQAQQLRGTEHKRLQQLRTQCIELLSQSVPRAVFTTPIKQVLPNNVHITLPGYDNERILMELDEVGIMCAAGSACSASSDEPSHVLKAIGLSDQEAQSSIRFTMGRSTSITDIQHVVATLAKLIE